MSQCWEYLFNNTDKVLYEMDLIIKKSTLVRNKVNIYFMQPSEPADKIIKLITDDTYEFNAFYSLVGLMQLIATSNDMKNVWIKCDNILTKYIKDMKSDNIFYKNIKKLRDLKYINKDDSIFLDNIINSFAKNNKINELNHKITNNIMNVKSTNFNIQLSNINKLLFNNKLINYQITKNNITVQLNKYSYKYLAKYIINCEERLHLDKAYNEITQFMLDDFVKLLISRSDYVKTLNFANYSNFKSNMSNNSDEYIRKLLKDIISKTTDSVYNKLYNLKNNYYKTNNNKICNADIIHYLENQYDKYKFSPNNVILVLLKLINNMFGLTFSTVDTQRVNFDGSNINAWNESVAILHVTNNRNESRGFLYIDILSNNAFKPIQPLYISLNNNWEYNSTRKTPVLVLVASYTSLTNEIMTYTDIVMLFKQFGPIIHSLCSTAKYGVPNYAEYYSDIMECCAWDIETVSKICGKNINWVSELLNIRKFDAIYSLRNTCINALFDNLIHTSDEFINLCKILVKQNNLGSNITKVYDELYNQFMNKFKNILYYEFDNINPNFIISILNDNASTLYSTVTNQILAYNIYNSIKSINRSENKYNKINKLIKTYILKHTVDYSNYINTINDKETKKELITDTIVEGDEDESDDYDNNDEEKELLNDTIDENTNYFQEGDIHDEPQIKILNKYKNKVNY
jgi:hypothetical protein